MLNSYEGQHYILAAIKFKWHHCAMTLELIPVNGYVLPTFQGGYTIDRARLYYEVSTGRTIEIVIG